MIVVDLDLMRAVMTREGRLGALISSAYPIGIEVEAY